jgi:peptidoglycan/xylan/chitin deacetylase (PgdA/CDA1 family)
VVWVIVNVEEWDIQGPMPRTVLPPPSGAQVIPDVPNFAWFEYGMRVGFWRLKSVLDKHKIKATLAINGSVCLTYPRIADASREAGWEFMGHGFIQKPMHQLEDQREAIRKSVEVIHNFTGKAPSGWLGPGLTETPETLDLLTEAGLQYVADWVNDDQPYEIKTAHGPLFSLPYTVELNDIPMMVLQHHEAEEFFRRTKDQFETLYAEGAKSARVMAIAVHPYISGVPHRIKYFEKALAYLKKQRGVLFWTGEQILDWYRSVQKAEG